MTEFSQQALAILWDASQFKWYVIPLLAIVFYIYTTEMEKKNWSLVLAGLAFWGWIRDRFLGIRYEDDEEQTDHCGHDLGSGDCVIDCVHPDP